MSELVQDWFRVWEDRPGIWVIEEPLHSEVVKSYLILGSARAVLIDSGMGVGDIRSIVESITTLPIVLLQSHAHNDHIGSSWKFADVSIHSSEANDLAVGQSAERLKNWFAPREMSGPLPASFVAKGYAIPGKSPTSLIEDGDLVELGGVTLEVLHCPGHSRGLLAFLDRANRNLYSTDVIYLRELYLLNPDSSVTDYVLTLNRLSAFASEIDRLYPSHGPTPIAPDLIPRMSTAMRSIAAGRTPDSVEFEPSIEGGVESVPFRNELRTYEFGEFCVLVSSEAQS